MDSEREQHLISVVTDITFLASSTDWDSEVAPLLLKLLFYHKKTSDLVKQILSRKPKMEFASLTRQIVDFSRNLNLGGELLYLITHIISLVSFMDLDSRHPKAESELISLINQIITLFNSKPDSESELVSLITQTMRLGISSEEPTQVTQLFSLITHLVSLKPEPELTSLIRHIISRFKSLDWKPKQFITLCPQVEGKLHDPTWDRLMAMGMGRCETEMAVFWRSTRNVYFYCRSCKGEKHEEYEKAPLELKHPLHPKHSLQLVLENGIRKCYCCDKDTERVFYYCEACDFALNIECVEKPRVLARDHPKWHKHTLALFPSQASFPCNLCALTHSTSCPFYICAPCDFVVHQECLSLPHVIRISRHPQHRISFTHSFEQGDWLCSVCRKRIHNDYGGYCCIKKGCLYAAHSKCATQSNVWDGIDLEGVPEEIEEEELEPFVRMTDGIIQHFSHQQHHLKVDENMGRDYDEHKLCQACTTPIYFGNFYSCVECEFILHDSCTNLSRRIYHPIHPHPLTLVTNLNGDISGLEECLVCGRFCTGFFYACHKESCDGFRIHIQCATVSEPLVHESHTHPLFLTSKPGERRTCGVCKSTEYICMRETFNCIECDFSVCFGCATIPHKVRYKHDKHLLTLSYGEEASTLEYWCEVCEGNIKPEEKFYKCDAYCCVTIHMECMIGKEFYMKLGLSLNDFFRGKINVLLNNRMSRPVCSKCKKRCPQKIVFENSGLIFCSKICFDCQT